MVFLLFVHLFHAYRLSHIGSSPLLPSLPSAPEAKERRGVNDGKFSKTVRKISTLRHFTRGTEREGLRPDKTGTVP